VLLTVTTTHRPAVDLGYLLHKHPDRVQQFGLPFGTAHVLYPEATEERCTAALILDVDPVALVRRGRGAGGFAFPLADYVNDRPYVASSFLSVALVNVYKSAMAGTCKARPELAATAIPLRAGPPAVPARCGEGVVRRLFGASARWRSASSGWRRGARTLRAPRAAVSRARMRLRRARARERAGRPAPVARHWTGWLT
jgi:hypothetical protein